MPSVGPLELLVTVAIPLIYIAIVVMAVLAARRVFRSDPVIDTLRSRLASGEIDEAEYDRLRSRLDRG